MTVDRDRLIKLLNMTESAHDGESLNAIRASNALMRQSKMTWSDLIAVASAPKPAPEPQPSPTQPEPKPAPIHEREEPAKRPPNWGQDIFGEQPSLPPNAHAPYPRSKKVQDAKDALRAKITTVPLWLRVPFFPIWAFASTYAAAVHAEPWPTKMVAILVPLVVGGIAGAVWVFIVYAIAQAFGYNGLLRG